MLPGQDPSFHLSQLGKVVEFDKKTYLLNEGDVCNKIYAVISGSVRSWFNNQGKDVTFQFFFEGDFVTSFESLTYQRPSLYNIETMSPSKLRVISQTELHRAVQSNPALTTLINNHIAQRLYHYQHLFLSRIKNSPTERYVELMLQQPDLLDKVPHHFIASYLGITPVTLSRIRSKLKDPINKR